MNLMLSVMLACVGIGLVAPGIGKREHLLIWGFALVMAALYLFFNRFM